MHLTQIETKYAGSLWIPAWDPPHVWYEWESHVGAALRLALGPGDFGGGCELFVDVGANIGYFARIAALARPSCRVIAAEPNPTLAEILARNLQELSNVERIAVAVGEEATTTEFYYRRGAEGNSRTYNPANQDGNAWACVSVPVVPLDELCRGSSRVVVKIDVEGYEPEVLRGALSLPPGTKFLTEMHATYMFGRGINLDSFYAWVREHFETSELSGESVVLPTEGNRNVLLVRR